MKRTALKKKPSKLRKLVKQADKLYQEKYIHDKPYSIISGEPTEVIHHIVYKSQSNNLRYDEKNGVPLTNKEHAQHHLSGDPSILAKILEVNGTDWFNDLQTRRRIVCKFNIEYISGIIWELTQIKRNPPLGTK